MPRHISTEAFQMDHLRSSPSQQHLEPSRSSSLQSHRNDDDEPSAPLGLGGERRPHKLDLYSIPVFLLEVLVLAALAYAAYFIHFEYKHEPMFSGFYCDDTSLRQEFRETAITKQFTRQDNELVVIALLLMVPIVLIVFCELVNSMFGSLKFRQIRALCACCKLHSITRRTIRFSGAYALGLMLVVISCDVLADSFGRFRPFFVQECLAAYNDCLVTALPPPSALQGRDLAAVPSSSQQQANSSSSPSDIMAEFRPQSQPISATTLNGSTETVAPPAALIAGQFFESQDVRVKRESVDKTLVERKWIDLSGANLKRVCAFSGDSMQTHRFDQIAMSWPSFPAAIVTYACLFVACYLCFVGTARPFRLITCVLVMVLLLLATVFNVQLVKEHYNHWEDVAAGSVLALVVVVFVLIVYLNKFRDTHYYESQKIHMRKMFVQGSSFRGYNNEGIGQYNLDKPDGTNEINNMQNGDMHGSNPNNDLAMRYFQIPRANYRGAPRPLSTMNQR